MARAKNKIVDIQTNMQVIGCVYLNPSLIEQSDKYSFSLDDFTEDFHKTIFGSIYNLFQLGARQIDASTIEEFLSTRPKNYGIYKANNGAKWLEQVSKMAQPSAFTYYYNRMKKFTLLRMYDDVGLDISDLYDVDNVFDVKKKQKQEEWLDNTSLSDIADSIDDKIIQIKLKYANITEKDFHQAAEGIDDLIESLKTQPEVGSPLYGTLINTVTRGARLGKFYLRSMPSGTGKTRMMVADACNMACDTLYDKTEDKWVKNGVKESSLYITTEQRLDEVQTAMLAFLAEVDEEHILTGKYEDDEEERVLYAANVLKSSPLHIKYLPDFSLQDIENTIKFAVHDWNTKYVFFDYLHSSMKILSEVSSKARVANLREDNVLFMISTRLKDLCNEYGVFIMTSTQLNGGWTDADVYDQNLLRGSKAVADRVDVGMIGLDTTERDKEALVDIVSRLGIEMPEMKISVYKNRRGRWKGILLWCKADRSTCRVNPIFVTNYNYELLPIEETNIQVMNFEDEDEK